MKTKFFYKISLLSFVLIMSHSCSQNVDVSSEEIELAKSYINNSPIVLPTSSLEWDESYHPDINSSRSVNNQSSEMAVTNSNIYI